MSLERPLKIVWVFMTIVETGTSLKKYPLQSTIHTPRQYIFLLHANTLGKFVLTVTSP